MIDVHCHPLPALDDGPTTVEEALALASAQVGIGVERIVATPHLSWEYDVTPERIHRGVDDLQIALTAAGIPLQVEIGAEITVMAAIEATDDELLGVTLGGAGWLLLEAPLALHAPGFNEMIQQVQSRGFRILLAHPERCPEIHRKPGLLKDLVGVGVRSQITASSLTGAFGRRVRDFSLDMIDDGLVHVVASDAHDVANRSPGLREEIASVGLSQAATWWTEEVPLAILAGETTPSIPGSVERLIAGGWKSRIKPDSEPGRWRPRFRRWKA